MKKILFIATMCIFPIVSCSKKEGMDPPTPPESTQPEAQMQPVEEPVPPSEQQTTDATSQAPAQTTDASPVPSK